MTPWSLDSISASASSPGHVDIVVIRAAWTAAAARTAATARIAVWPVHAGRRAAAWPDSAWTGTGTWRPETGALWKINIRVKIMLRLKEDTFGKQK